MVVAMTPKSTAEPGEPTRTERKNSAGWRQASFQVSTKERTQPRVARAAKGASASPNVQGAPGIPGGGYPTGQAPAGGGGWGAGCGGGGAGSVGAAPLGSARWTFCPQWGHGCTPKRSVSKVFWQKAQRAS